MQVQPNEAEEKDAAEEGYFFQSAGAIRFSDAGIQAPGYAVNIVVADRYGFVAYSDLAAVYIATAYKLLEAASPDAKSPPVLDPATVCVSKLPVPNVTILSLSADQLLLACVSGSSVQIFSLPHLLNHQSDDAPVYTMSLSRELSHFSWCPDFSARDSTSFIAVTEDHVLLHGSLISGSGTLAEGVESACWSPSGQHVAYSSGSKLVVTAPDWKETAFVVDVPPPCPEDESGDGVHVVDSITWPAPAAIAASSLWYDEAADEEGADGYLLGITWDSWQGTATAEPQGLKASLTSYVTVANLDEDPCCGQHEWPYLRGVYIAAWHLLVHAHRKAYDEHIRLMQLTDGQVCSLEQSETRLVAAVPTPDDGENFILGMAVDYSNQDTLPHPLSQEKPDVPASCVLLVTTVDGVLRLYRLANFEQKQGLARSPQLVPSSLPQCIMDAIAVARNALLEEESETSVSSPSPPMSSFMQQLASAQSSISGAAPSTGFNPGPAAAQQQYRRSLAEGSTITPIQEQQQQLLLDAAAAHLPLEDDDELDELEEAGDGALSLNAGDVTAVGRGKATDDGWGSSEEGDEAEEATSQPAQGHKAETGQSGKAPSTEPVDAASSSVPHSNSNGTLFGKQPALPVADQPFGSTSSAPALSFAAVGSAGNLPAGATASAAIGGAFGGSFGLGVAGNSAAATTLCPAPGSSAMKASSSAPTLGAATKPVPALGSRSSVLDFAACGSQPPNFTAQAAAADSTGQPEAARAAAAAGKPPSLAAATSKPLLGESSATPSSGSALPAPSVDAASSSAACPAGAASSSAPSSPFGTPTAFSTPTADSSAATAAPSAALLNQSTAAGNGSSLPSTAAAGQAAAASKGAFTMPTMVAGTYGTGYYQDMAPQPVLAASTPAVVSRAPRSSATTTSAAADQARSVAAGSAAATGRKVAAQQQQHAGASKAQVKLPSVTVAAPKPQLVAQGQQVAEAEAAFLRSLHQVVGMSAELQQLVTQMVPEDVTKWEGAQRTQKLRKQAIKLRAAHQQQKQSAAQLIDSWDDTNRQQAALAMFHPNTAGTDAIEAQMPLEPALAALQDNIQESIGAITNNMEDLEQQLDRWQQTVQPAAAWNMPLMGAKAAAVLASSRSSSTGPFRAMGLKTHASSWSGRAAGARTVSSMASPRVAQPGRAAGAPDPAAQVELLYKVVNAQQDTARNLAARITMLAQELERLGVVRTDTEHMGGKTLGKWGDDMGGGPSYSDDGEYGSGPGVDEDDYERGSRTPPSRLAASTLFSSPATGATPAASAGRELPRTIPGSSSSVGGTSAAAISAPGPRKVVRGVDAYLSVPKSAESCQRASAAASPAAATLYNSSKLHWVTPGSSGAKKQPSSSSSQQRQQQRAGSRATTSSAAWQKFATELSNSASKSAGGSTSGCKSRVRTTVATPLPASGSRGTSRRQLQQKSGATAVSPTRPPSPLHITAASAALTTSAGPTAPSAAFSFPGHTSITPPATAVRQQQQLQQQQQQHGLNTPTGNRLPGKLNFSPAAAASPSASSAAAGLGPTPGGLFGGLSPVPVGTPGLLESVEENKNSSAFSFFSANPLFDGSPGAVAQSPMAAVPPAALQLGAGAARAAGGGGSDAVTGAAMLKPPPTPAASKPKSSQPPEPPLAALAKAAALEHKVLNRSTSIGSSGSSPQPPLAASTSAAGLVKPAAASKATSRPPEPPAALQAAAARAAKQLPQQAKAAEPATGGPTPAAVSAAAAAARRVLDSQKGAAATAAGPKASSQPPEPLVVMTQQAQAALQRMAASQAAGSAATSTAKPKASTQPPEPPSSLLHAAAEAANKASQQNFDAAASTSAGGTVSRAPALNDHLAKSFGACGSTTSAAFQASSGTPPSSSALFFGSLSSSSAASSAAAINSSGVANAPAAVQSSSNAADALSAMLGAQHAGGAFGGFGALGLGGGAATTSTSSAPPFAGLSLGALPNANAFGAAVSGSSAAPLAPAFSTAAITTTSPFGSLGPASNSATASTSSSIFGRSSAFGRDGGSSVQSASSPFGALLSGSGAGSSSSVFGASGSAFGTAATSSAASSSPFGALAQTSAASSSFGASTTSVSSSAFFAGSAAAGFGQASPFGATATGGLMAAVGPPFGQPASPGSPFGGATTTPSSAFGAPATSSAATATGSVFGSFGQSTTFGHSSSAGTPFGQAAAFGQTATSVFEQQSSAFGQAAAPSAPFGGVSSAFGQPSTSAAAFGQISTPSSQFGPPGTPASPPSGGVFGAGFGQPATPSSAGSSLLGFSGAASSGGGFGAFGAASSRGAGFSAPNPFGGAAPQQQQQQPSLWAARR